jgi:ankyrin repeat protein
LTHGANIDVKDNFYETALDYASLYGHKEVVALLEEHAAKKLN